MMLSSVSITIVTVKRSLLFLLQFPFCLISMTVLIGTVHFDTKVKQVYHYSAFYFDLKVNI